MQNILFLFLIYGITNIIIFGSIFTSFRDFWLKYNPNFFGKLFTCPLCLSTWVGGIISLTFNYFGYKTPFSNYGLEILPLIIFCDACLSSGVVWVIHNFEEMLERVGNN
jgi:hypothetical protein